MADSTAEFLSFRKFITPIFIQALFWIAVGLNTIAALATIFHGGVSILAGLVLLVVGPFVARIYCELIILLFRIYEELVAIRTGATPGSGFPITPSQPAPMTGGPQ